MLKNVYSRLAACVDDCCVSLISRLLTTASMVVLLATYICAQTSLPVINNGVDWLDTSGNVINAHGGCMLYVDGVYYWYGECRPMSGYTSDGVRVYSSTNLVDWVDEGFALALSKDENSPIVRGCIVERPRVVFNVSTNLYVMLFHLELKGQNYDAALTGFATASSPKGPFTFVRALRPLSGVWPYDFDESQCNTAQSLVETDYRAWTSQWRRAVSDGLYLSRDFYGGQMSRDLTVFVDDDGTAYHLYASEENLTLHLAQLTPDYLDYTGRYIRINPGGHNEAPILFRRDNTYWLIASGCTGWKPNEARMYKASSIWGPWRPLSTPYQGRDALTSFHSQASYLFTVHNLRNTFILMADQWNPRSLARSRYLWLPLSFRSDGTPVVYYQKSWSPEQYNMWMNK